jgi:hypothetical protein
MCMGSRDMQPDPYIALTEALAAVGLKGQRRRPDLLSAIQPVARNRLSPVKNGSEHCTPGRPVRIALRLWREGTMTQGWITQRLEMAAKSCLFSRYDVSCLGISVWQIGRCRLQNTLPASVVSGPWSSALLNDPTRFALSRACTVSPARR